LKKIAPVIFECDSVWGSSFENIEKIISSENWKT